MDVGNWYVLDSYRNKRYTLKKIRIALGRFGHLGPDSLRWSIDRVARMTKGPITITLNSPPTPEHSQRLTAGDVRLLAPITEHYFQAWPPSLAVVVKYDTGKTFFYGVGHRIETTLQGACDFQLGFPLWVRCNHDDKNGAENLFVLATYRWDYLWSHL